MTLLFKCLFKIHNLMLSPDLLNMNLWFEKIPTQCKKNKIISLLAFATFSVKYWCKILKFYHLAEGLGRWILNKHLNNNERNWAVCGIVDVLMLAEEVLLPPFVSWAFHHESSSAVRSSGIHHESSSADRSLRITALMRFFLTNWG